MCCMRPGAPERGWGRRAHILYANLVQPRSLRRCCLVCRCDGSARAPDVWCHSHMPKPAPPQATCYCRQLWLLLCLFLPASAGSCAASVLPHRCRLSLPIVRSGRLSTASAVSYWPFGKSDCRMQASSVPQGQCLLTVARRGRRAACSAATPPARWRTAHGCSPSPRTAPRCPPGT